MAGATAYALVFAAGLVTALATGLGALPFFIVETVSARANVALWGVASGIMLTASAFGLLPEGLAAGRPVVVAGGLIVGALFVVVGHAIVDESEINPRKHEKREFRRFVLVVGVLTAHSLPEGVAIGVAFAGLTAGGVTSVPSLAVAMTVAISVHNVPEGVAISIPLRDAGASPPRMVGWSVFSSLPQPLGAVLAFGFVRLAEPLLPFGFGLAAGAMAYLVVAEFIPEALAAGRELSGDGLPELAAGIATGGLGMGMLLVAV
ncbi:ZIP family metal transporter [Halosegnis sp.]|uniref:ZIP family metal transporter n=1 Tax=Halosegnis sp. TaxID=2864959 RepID=UPI0035D4AFAC